MTPKPNTIEYQTAQAVDPATHRSALRLHRLVVQLVETPKNIDAIDRLLASAKGILGHVDGPHACIKREAVEVNSLFTSRAPSPALDSRPLRDLLKAIERHCPCGARPESITTHPHVIGCPVQAALLLSEPNGLDQARAAPRADPATD